MQILMDLVAKQQSQIAKLMEKDGGVPEPQLENSNGGSPEDKNVEAIQQFSY